jgi:hypothetical protein
MSNKSLPAYLQQVLEHHVANNELTHDDELQRVFDRLTKLNSNVELLKQKILANRNARG